MRKIKATRFYSLRIGRLAKGCRLCVKGKKSVLFVTGLCSKHCFFCPISEKKWMQDHSYINEWRTSKIGDIVKEIKLCDSGGVGITGGDPLCRLSRTEHYIKSLKKRFGKEFHIHLYTPLNLVTLKRLERLYKAGLDEIRFHPDIGDKSLWKRIKLASKFDWSLGVEIPAIPKKRRATIELISYLDKAGVDFLNINELELSDTNASKILALGFKPKDSLSYGVKGSEELAIALLEYCSENTGLNVHYCTTKLKDSVQLARRIKRRAKNVRKAFDKVTNEGMLVRGAIYLGELFPGEGYARTLERLNTKEKKKIIRRLLRLKEKLGIEAPQLVEVDREKLRILTSTGIIKKLKNELKNLNLRLAVVEEYPTHDSMIVELEFI